MSPAFSPFCILLYYMNESPTSISLRRGYFAFIVQGDVLFSYHWRSRTNISKGGLLALIRNRRNGATKSLL